VESHISTNKLKMEDYSRLTRLHKERDK
jgi:hypothetical protein